MAQGDERVRLGAIQAALNRGYGRPAQAVQVGADPGALRRRLYWIGAQQVTGRETALQVKRSGLPSVVTTRALPLKLTVQP